MTNKEISPERLTELAEAHTKEAIYLHGRWMDCLDRIQNWCDGQDGPEYADHWKREYFRYLAAFESVLRRDSWFRYDYRQLDQMRAEQGEEGRA